MVLKMETKYLIDPANIFSFRGKKYTFHSACLGPSITMKCLDDDNVFSFGATAPIKDEFMLIANDHIKPRRQGRNLNLKPFPASASIDG